MKSKTLILSHNKKKSLVHFFLKTLVGRKGKMAFVELFLKFISEIQVIAMLLYFPFDLIENESDDTLGYFTQQICKFISFSDIFPFDSNSWAINTLWYTFILYFVFLIAAAIFIMVHHFLNKEINRAILQTWVLLGMFHCSIGFMLTYQYSYSLLEVQTNSTFTLLGQGESAGLAAIVYLQIPINIAFALVFCKFLYSPFKNSYLASQRKTTSEMLILLFKICDIPLDLLIQDATIEKWARLAFMMIIFLANIKVQIKDVQYYHYKPTKLFSRISFVYLALSISDTLIVILNEAEGVQALSSVYLSAILSIFFIKFSDLVLANTIKNSAARVFDDVKSRNDFYRKLLALDLVMEKGSNRLKTESKRRETSYEYLFYAMMSQHKTICDKAICGCKVLTRRSDSKREHTIQAERELKDELKMELTKDLYRMCLKKLPSDVEIRLAFANFLFETKSHSDGSSISLVHSLDLDTRNVEMRVIASTLLENIEKKIENNSNQTLNIKEVIDFQSLSNELRREIETNTAKFIEFWEMYKSADPSILTLFSKSVKINREADQIASIWNRMVTKYTKLSYNDHLFYGLYQSLVRSRPYSAEKTLQTYFTFANNYDSEQNRAANITSDNVFESNNISIYITMRREKVGFIQFATSNIEEYLQYSPKDIIDKNVNIIMPPFYQERHQKVLYAHLEKGKTSVLNTNMSVFGRKKDGHIIPFTLYTTIFPYLQDHLLYVGILRPLPTNYEYLLVLNDGTIDGISEGVAKKVGINPRQNRRYHLRDISRELTVLHRRFLPFIRDALFKAKAQADAVSQSQSYVNFHNTSGTGLIEPTRKLDSNKEDDPNSKSKKESGPTIADRYNEESLRLYEEYTSSGAAIYLYKLGQGGDADPEKKPHRYGYNTIIEERFVQGSHLRVYQLQPLAMQDTVNEINTTQKVNSTKGVQDTQMTAPNYLVTNEDQSKLEASLPADHSIVKIDGEEVLFRNPFSNDNTNILELVNNPLSPKDILSQKDRLLPSDLFSHRTQPVNQQEALLSPKDPASPKDKLLPSDLFSNRTQPANQQEVLLSPKDLASPKDRLLPSELFSNRTQIESAHETRINTNYPMSGLTRAATYDRLESAGQLLYPRPTYETKSAIKDDPQQEKPKVESLEESDQSSANKSEMSEKVKKTELKKFLKEHKIITVGMEDVAERSSVASSARVNKINSRLENAIYLSESDIVIKILTYVIVFFCLISVGMLVYTQTVTNKNLVRVKNNIDILRLSYQRLAYIVEVNRRSWRIKFIQAGLASRVRHTSDYVSTNQVSLFPAATNLSYYNYQLRNTIHNVDTSEQDSFYDLIPEKTKYNINAIRQVNTFDLCTELVEAVLEIYALRPSQPTTDDSNINFILNNTLNDLLVVSSDVNTILRVDTSVRLSTIQNTMIGVLCIVMTAIGIIYTAVVKTEHNFIKAKAHFLEVFLMIRDHEIEQPLHIVSTFYTSLKENRRETRFMEKVANEKFLMKTKVANSKKSQAKSFKAKKANFKNTNTQITLNLVFTLIYLGIFGILFGVVLGLFNVSKTSIDNSRTRVVDAKVIFLRYGLIMASLYEYITLNDTTYLLNNPIGSEWESLYTILTNSTSYLSTFIEPGKDYNQRIEYVLSGDLCSLLYPTRPTCYTDSSGISSKGIIGINGFLMKYGRNVKNFYDASNQTVAAQTAALEQQDLIDSEVLYEVYGKAAYTELDTWLALQFTTEVNTFLDNALLLIILSAVILVIVTRLIWITVSKRMDRERLDYRRMMRVIPVSVITSNRFVKNYLFNHSKKILDTVKNKM